MEGGNELIILLNDPWDFTSANLKGSLLVSDTTLLIYLASHQKIEGP